MSRDRQRADRFESAGAPVKPTFQLRTLPPEIRAFVAQLIFIALVLAFPFGIATSAGIFRDGDTSWQIAAGEWMLRNGTIPTTDPFSYTAAGHPWVAMEWLAETVYALVFSVAGFTGVALTVAAAVIALHALLFFYLQRRVSMLVLAVTLLTLDFVLAPFVLARPHVLAWPLLAGWTILLLTTAERGRPPSLWSAVILTVWTNLHASFPLAIPIAAAIALDSLIEARWATWRQWLAFGVASLVAISLNANGISGLLQPFRTSALAMLPLIGEWHASSPHATPFFFGVLLIGIGALLWRGVDLPIGRLLLLLAMLALAFAHVRHQGTFIIVAACIVPPLFQSKPVASQVPKWLMVGALPILVMGAFLPMTPPESEANPRRLIAAVPTNLRNEPVFNSYIFGGPLILAGIRPYIDGRAEVYGDAFVADYVKITEGDIGAFNRAVGQYNIRWVMLATSQQQLIKAIESSGAWKRIYSDEAGVIDVRTDA